MLGVIQEQHGDRCRLFQQWQQLDFPVVQDKLNTNGIAVVPYYVGIDPLGRVMGARYRSPSQFIQQIAEQDTDTKNDSHQMDMRVADVSYWSDKLVADRTVSNLINHSDAKLHWQPQDEQQVAKAIEGYEEALKLANQAGPDKPRYDLHFRLGVAKRMLYELNGQVEAQEFAASVQHWEQALKINPNQYIYRRRIEQYGPRLKKPYSFYDWVKPARKDIKARGEVPHPLAVEPNGAEFAQRARSMDVQRNAENPDPGNQIQQMGDQVQVHINTVPTQPKPGQVVAVHIGFHVSGDATWNHEATPLQVWLDAPDGSAKLSAQLIEDQAPYVSESSVRPVSISLEMKMPEQASPITLSGYGLFHVCEKEGGQCVYRRKNFQLVVGGD